MKTNWQHQKEAITTDQRNRHRDEHADEQEKKKLGAKNQPQAEPAANSEHEQKNTNDRE